MEHIVFEVSVPHVPLVMEESTAVQFIHTTWKLSRKYPDAASGYR